MFYINKITGEYPLTEDDIKKRYSNTSFTIPFSPPESYDIVNSSDKPVYNTIVKSIKLGTPLFKQEDNKWYETWIVESKFKPLLENSQLISAEVQEERAISEYTLKIKKEIIDSILNRVQEKLDNFAKTRGYDGILSATTYATSTVTKFQQEGQYAVIARDQMWSRLYEVLQEIESGSRSFPQNFEEIEGLLPVLQWPN